jgi:hypothetical protein
MLQTLLPPGSRSFWSQHDRRYLRWPNLRRRVLSRLSGIAVPKRPKMYGPFPGASSCSLGGSSSGKSAKDNSFESPTPRGNPLALPRRTVILRSTVAYGFRTQCPQSEGAGGASPMPRIGVIDNRVVPLVTLRRRPRSDGFRRASSGLDHGLGGVCK